MQNNWGGMPSLSSGWAQARLRHALKPLNGETASSSQSSAHSLAILLPYLGRMLQSDSGKQRLKPVRSACISSPWLGTPPASLWHHRLCCWRAYVLTCFNRAVASKPDMGGVSIGMERERQQNDSL